MKKFSFLFVILVVFSVMLAACDFPPQRAGSTPPPSDGEADTATGDTGGAPGSVSTLDAVLAQTQSADTGSGAVDDAGEGTGGGASASFDEQFLTTEAGVTQTAQAIVAAPVVTATPTMAPTAAPLPDPAVPESYALHKGEHPYCVARRFDVNVQDLIRVNGLVSGTVYSEGFKLTIPQDAGPFESARQLRAHPGTYVTQPGDTFYSVACTFGDISPDQIAAANGMSVGDTLTSGLTLQIP